MADFDWNAMLKNAGIDKEKNNRNFSGRIYQKLK
jgi:hypothetical protein